MGLYNFPTISDFTKYSSVTHGNRNVSGIIVCALEYGHILEFFATETVLVENFLGYFFRSLVPQFQSCFLNCYHCGQLLTFGFDPQSVNCCYHCSLLQFLEYCNFPLNQIHESSLSSDRVSLRVPEFGRRFLNVAPKSHHV